MADPTLVRSALDSLNENTKRKQRGEICFSDCPNCGHGEDRFWVNPYKESAWCRHCGYSGSITQVVRDLTGCTRTEAKAKLGESEWSPDQRWIYEDEDGNALFEKTKKVFDDGKKQYGQTGPGGKKYEKTPPRRMYREAQASKASMVCIAGGEKDVDALVRLNLEATCNPDGEGSFFSTDPDSLNKVLSNKKGVWIFCDNDQTGNKMKQDVISAVTSRGIPAKVIELPDLPEKGDVSDFIFKHGPEKAKDMIIEIAKNTKPVEVEPDVEFMTAYELAVSKYERVETVIGGGILNRQESMMLSANYGQMKSMLRTQMALSIAANVTLLDVEQYEASLKDLKVVVYQWENADSLEGKRVRKMAHNMGIDLKSVGKRLVFVPGKVRFDISNIRGKRDLFQSIKRSGADVVFFDNLSQMHSCNENDNVDMRRVVDVLTEYNKHLGITSVLIHHMRKPGKDDGEAKYRIRGAVSLQDWASTIGTIEHLKKTPDVTVKRLEWPKIRDPEVGVPEAVEIAFRDWHFKISTEESPLSPEAIRKLVALEPKGMSQTDLLDVLMAKSRLGDRKCRDAVYDAREKSYIVMEKIGRSKFYKTGF